MLDVEHPTKTTYYPQTNERVEWYNRTMVTRLRHYVAENQKNWDKYVQPLSYAYNTQEHKPPNITPFSLVLTRHPPELTAVSQPSCLCTVSYVRADHQSPRFNPSGNLLHCRQKPIRICVNGGRSIGITLTRRYTTKQSLYGTSGCLRTKNRYLLRKTRRTR